MKNKIDNILLATLWFLASTLGICFWFNIQYGFNIFSNAHWRHLAYMQATQNPVRTSFYISVAAAIIIVIGGLYLLIRPHFRKIKTKTATQPQQPVITNVIQDTTDESVLSRPKRLKVSVAPIITPAPDTSQTPQNMAPTAAPVTAPVAPATRTPAQQTTNDPELTSIFQDAGYVIKPSPRISGLQTSVMAIGSGETVWIGATDIETSALQSAIDAMTQLFQETLEDIPITVHGFVINATDANAPKATNILTFATNDDLRNYISANPNPPVAPDDAENFEAYSSYISTVIDYLRKV